jgi:hypothetical protein
MDQKVEQLLEVQALLQQAIYKLGKVGLKRERGYRTKMHDLVLAMNAEIESLPQVGLDN